MAGLARISGIALAAVGVSHFVRPQLYHGMTTVIFPEDTLRHVYLDGVAETVLGVGLIHPATRPWAVAGAVGYLGYLCANAVRHR